MGEVEAVRGVATLDELSLRTATVVVGDFGSGKTEIAVNLTLQLAARYGDRQVSIADLDLVNPYFRCREAREPLERVGIRVVMPKGDGREFADLPILLPEVKGLLTAKQGMAVLDVGGDASGARALAALSGAWDGQRHALWFVVNARRPFCDTAAGCLQTIRRIETTTGLTVSGLISNTHLMEETTPQMVLDGVAVAEEVGKSLGVPLALVSVMEAVYRKLPAGSMVRPVLVMSRLMVPPWSRRAMPKLGPAALRDGVG